MREIKFRAMYKGKMQPISGYGSASGGTFVLDESIDSPLMQYTGLKDKNGKEIYEGDVVRGTTDEWDAETKTTDVVVIEWNDDTCGFLPFSSYDCDCGTQTLPSHVKVIGKIYEHPDLLLTTDKQQDS